MFNLYFELTFCAKTERDEQIKMQANKGLNTWQIYGRRWSALQGDFFRTFEAIVNFPADDLIRLGGYQRILRR
jgi:hypothetical protein